MPQYTLLINNEYCTGCHSCEIACRNEHNIPRGKWGIKLTEVEPFKLDEMRWEWIYNPVPTSLCDLCADRAAAGKKPACVHHCLAFCLEYGTVEEMTARMQQIGKKVSIVIP